MSRVMKSIDWKKVLKICLAISAVIFILFCIWTVQLYRTVSQKIEQGWFLAPTEIYSRPEPIRPGQLFLKENVSKQLISQNHYRQRTPAQNLKPGDFVFYEQEKCQTLTQRSLDFESIQCLVVYHPESTRLKSVDGIGLLQAVVFNSENKILDVYEGDPLKEKEVILFPPQLFAQFYNDKPILRRFVQIGDVPLQCLQSITAIEDVNFLKHKGISVTGILRSVFRNIVKGRYAQGGSTITQQLVKNYFLTPEKTIKRKITEWVMAVILEALVEKDQILANYLNVIYMGQNGPFEVRGFGAAAEHYFNTPLEELSLDQCALLSAIVNSPGRYNPFRNVDRAKERRTKVLGKMIEHSMITQEEHDIAEKAPLPKKQNPTLSEPAPYFVQAIQRQLEKMKVDQSDGLKVYTSLSVFAQEAAQTAVPKHIKNLEKHYKNLKAFAKEKKYLQASLISVDIKSGEVIALVGGRSFRSTQYNRVLDAHRQVGSIMKPFVYLAALETLDENGNNYNPLTILEDSPYTYKYEGQKWSPKNYSKTFMGPVPMFYALKNSMNVPTAKLGISIGLESILGVTARAGITSQLKPLPSITLGAFEIYPWELAQAYNTIANFGEYKELTFINSIYNGNNELIFEKNPKTEPRLSKETTATLIGMLQQTVETGTAVGIRRMKFEYPAAGKTGTTSDSKDAWFVGFTPEILTLVWIGYDDNTKHGLTGASGAVPIWAMYMNAIKNQLSGSDFKWPEAVVEYNLSADKLQEMVPKAREIELQKPTRLIFRSENAPN